MEEETSADINCFRRTTSSSSDNGVPYQRVRPFKEPPSDVECYDLSKEKYLYIFNHYSYHKRSPYFGPKIPPNRNGTDRDVENLETVFKNLGFTPKTFNDHTHDEIINEVVAISKRCKEAPPSCLVIAVLTHGKDKGTLLAADRPYSMDDVITPFIHLKELAGVPKLFLIQACRGDETDSGTVVYDGEASRGHIIPTHADVLILRSAIEDYISFRDIRGSWMIQELCKTIQNHPKKDILHLTIVLNKRVAYDYISNIPHIPKLDKKKQMPNTYHTLTKFLVLNPGTE